MIKILHYEFLCLQKLAKPYLCICLFFLFPVLTIQAQQWQQVPLVSQAILDAGIFPGGEGGQVIRATHAASADPNFVLMATDVGGVYRSLDGGNKWQVCMVGWNSRGGNGFAVDPRNVNRVVGIGANSNDIGSANGLYLSINKAASWSQTLSVGTSWQGDIAYDRTSYNEALGYCTVVYYAGSSGLWKSTNGGASWSKIKEGFYNALIEVHPTLGYVYVASNNGDDHGFWRSIDGGSNFIRFTDDYVTGLDVIDTQPNNVYISRWFKVWKSTNSGENFGYVGDNYPNDGLPDGVPILGLTVSPSNPDKMLCYYDAGNWSWPKFYTNNGGKTWQPVAVSNANSFIPVNDRSPAWSWHATNENIIYGNGGDIITKSTNGGQTFLYSGNGENAIMVGGKINISPTSPNSILLGTQDYNAAVTTSGGSVWKYSNPSGNGWGGYCYGGYALDANIMWLGNADSWGGARILKVSRNGGDTWTPMMSGSVQIVFSGADIGYSDPNNTNNCFASNWRSTDKGLSWSAMPGCDGVFTSNPTGSKELYGKKGDTIVKSTNGGSSWTTVFTVPGGFNDVAFDHLRNRFYVASEDQLKRIENNIITTIITPVDQYNSTRVSSVAVDPIDPAIVYVGNHRDIYACNNALVRSIDAGMSWQNLTATNALNDTQTGGPHEVMSIRVHPVTRFAWVSGQCYGMWKIGPPNTGNTSVFDGLYKIVAKHSGRALDVDEISYQDGANIHQWEYVGGTNQQWEVSPVGGGYHKIIAHHSGKSLDVKDFSTSDGGDIQQWGYSGSNNQQWQFDEVEPGYYRIISKHSGKALDVNNAGLDNGEDVIQYAPHTGNNQRWSITPIGSAGRIAQSETKSELQTEGLRIYPNPAQDIVHVSFNEPIQDLIIHDIMGRAYESKTRINQSTITLNLTAYPKGTYIIRGVTNSSRSITGKFIVR